MEYRLATAWATALLLAVTSTASAQTSATSSQKDKGDAQQSKGNSESSDKREDRDKGESQGETMTIRGEVAGVSVLGETMVDYSTGRGVLAEFTYLTVLGSPSGEPGKSGDDSGKTDAADDKADNSAKGSGKEGSSDRRRVYQIAVGPETQVCEREASGNSQNSSDASDGKKGSAREKSMAALERLELGDRVEIQFEHKAHHNQGENQAASGNHARHGRHRMVRGVAKSITILSTPSDNVDKNRDKSDSASSSDKEKSDTDAKDKK